MGGILQRRLNSQVFFVCVVVFFVVIFLVNKKAKESLSLASIDLTFRRFPVDTSHDSLRFEGEGNASGFFKDLNAYGDVAATGADAHAQKRTSRADHFKSDINRLEGFHRDWCRVRDARLDWKAISSSCRNKTAWDQRTFGQQSDLKTDAQKSVISQWVLGEAGEFSKFFIQSKTALGVNKSVGGDSWRIHVKGASSVPVTVLDNNNGSYEVLFLVYEPGEYRVEIVLDYTMCDGLKDPPRHWFRSGNKQGKNQPDGILQGERPYLLQKFRKEPIDIEIKPSSKFWNRSLDSMVSCDSECPSLMVDGFGRWFNKAWQPYRKEAVPKLGHTSRRGTLMIFGDSVANNFRDALVAGPYAKLCRDVFTSCDVTYNWVYNMRGYWGDGVTSPREPVPDGQDFDAERVISDFVEVLYSPKMDEHSVLFINWGIHFAAAVSFRDYQGIIDRFVKIVTSRDPRIRAKIIWKTSTALNRERFPNPHKDVRRFLTFHRVLLYNAYATSAMCRAGIPVIDVYPMSDAFPQGTVSLSDPVHYSGGVFRSVEQMLYDMFNTK